MKKIALLMAVTILISLTHSPLAAEEVDYSRLLVCSKAFEALGLISDSRAKETLKKGLKSPDFLLRAYAAEALGRLKSPDVVPLLQGASKDRNYLVSVSATKALVELGESFYEKKLLNFLNDTRPEVRATAIEQLGDLGNKYLSLLVRALLKDTDELVRVKAIEQLGVNKFNPALGYIRKASEDKSSIVRQAACAAIGEIGGQEEKSLLNLRLSDPDIYVRAAAKVSLSLLAKNAKVSMKSSFIDLLWQDTKSENPINRVSSYTALANLNDINVVGVVLKELVSSDSPALIKVEGARALMVLQPHLFDLAQKRLSGSKDGIIPVDSLQVFYSVNGKILAMFFIDALIDAKNPLHKDAPLVLKELKDNASCLFLRQALFDKDSEFQASVVYALGDLKDKDAVTDIIKLCKQYGF